MMKYKVDSSLYFLIGINVLVGVCSYLFIKEYDCAHPQYLYLLALIPFLSAIYYFFNRGYYPKIKLSGSSFFIQKQGIFWQHFPVLMRSLKFLGLAFLIFALSRPQSQLGWADSETEGIDIIIVMDVSASMLARDFRPNRLEASKKVAMSFIDKRPNDRIGLVVYEGESFTQCPLTTDHKILKNLFQDVNTGYLTGGTAVGLGIGTAINRLKDSKAKSRVMILLTDGVSNAGSISPLTAAEVAKEFGIRVYTIGVGTNGLAQSPIAKLPNGGYRYDYVPVEIDEKTMKQIAKMTKGKYFRATNEKKLKKIYEEIDELEKTKIKVTEHSRKTEEYLPMAIVGLSLVLLSILVKEFLVFSLP